MKVGGKKAISCSEKPSPCFFNYTPKKGKSLFQTVDKNKPVQLQLNQFNVFCTSSEKIVLQQLRYQGSNSNSHRVAKFVGFVNLFILFNSQINIFFLLNLLLLFLSDQLGDTKTIRPFALKGHGPIAHSALPHGLLTCSPFGLRV